MSSMRKSHSYGGKPLKPIRNFNRSAKASEKSGEPIGKIGSKNPRSSAELMPSIKIMLKSFIEGSETSFLRALSLPPKSTKRRFQRQSTESPNYSRDQKKAFVSGLSSGSLPEKGQLRPPV